MSFCAIHSAAKSSGQRARRAPGCRHSLYPSSITNLILAAAAVFLAAGLSVARDSAAKLELK